jgi:hypothetical protein
MFQTRTGPSRPVYSLVYKCRRTIEILSSYNLLPYAAAADIVADKRSSRTWTLACNGDAESLVELISHSEAVFGRGSNVGVHLDSWLGRLSFFINRRPIG